MNQIMRIDKFLWCIRLYKTRTLASAACKAGKILSSGDALKAAYECKTGLEFTVKNGALKNSYRILGFPSSRVAAKLVDQYLLETTSETDKERNKTILESRKENAFYEFGKPTKKDRRKISKFKGN